MNGRSSFWKIGGSPFVRNELLTPCGMEAEEGSRYRKRPHVMRSARPVERTERSERLEEGHCERGGGIYCGLREWEHFGKRRNRNERSPCELHGI